MAVWVIAFDQALTWIVVSIFSFALSIGVLRWKEGTFTGRSIQLIGLGAVIYTMTKAVIEVLLTELSGDDYSLAFGEISETWFVPIMATVLYYLLRTVVQSFEEATFALNKGQITQKPVQTKFGFHIIILNDVRESKPKKLSEIEQQIIKIIKKNSLLDLEKKLKKNQKIIINKFEEVAKKVNN
jgi:peptidyl-prolyl cis-trans isomerase C